MIIWLASYPKSGNTFMRSFLTSYTVVDGCFQFSIFFLLFLFSDFIEASPQQSLDQSTLPNYKLQIARLAKIIHEARFNRYLTNELSRFVINIHVCRRRVFRSLSTNRPHGPLDGALRSRHFDALEF